MWKDEVPVRTNDCLHTEGNVNLLESPVALMHCRSTENNKKWKSAQRDANTAHRCSKVERKIFVPPQTPVPGARDDKNLISWRWSLPLPTDPVCEDRCTQFSSYRDNRPTKTHTPTNKHTNKQTNPQTVPITIHCAAAIV